MADWLQYDPNTLPWMRRSGEAAREATAQFQFGAQLAQRREEQRTEEAYKERVLQLQKDTLDLKKASELQIKEGMVEASKVLSQIAAAGSWDNPESEARFLDVVAKHPAFASSEAFPRLRASFENARKIKADAEALKIRMDRGFAPSELEKSLTYMIGQGFITPEEAATLGKEKFLGPSETMEMGTDENGRPVVKIVKGRSTTTQSTGPTVGFKTKLQEQLANDAGTVELLGVMQNNMTDADFGLRGVARDLKVRLGGQLGLDVEDEDLSVRKTIPLLRAALQKALKTDSNITEAERQDIKKALPSEGWLESRKNAEESINVLMPWLRNRARRSATELGVAPPIWAMSADEIRAAYKAGTLSEEDALKAIQQFKIQIPNAR